MSRPYSMWLVASLGLIVGCAASTKPIVTTHGVTATCDVALEVTNRTESGLNVYWTALNRSGPAIRVGHAATGKSTIRLPETVASGMKNGGSYFFSRRLTPDESRVDERKLTYQPSCL